MTEFQRQLQLLDVMLSTDGKPYLCGSEVSLADATIFPTMVFAKYMLPKFGISLAFTPKLDARFDWVKENDAAFRGVGCALRLSARLTTLSRHRMSPRTVRYGSQSEFSGLKPRRCH